MTDKKGRNNSVVFTNLSFIDAETYNSKIHKCTCAMEMLKRFWSGVV